MSRETKMRCFGFTLALSSSLFCISSAQAGTVGVLANTIYNGMSSPEVLAAESLGHTVEILTAEQWAAKSTAEFAAYDALILGDPDCQDTTAAVAAAESNAAVWAAAVQGNVIVIGTDPTYHQKGGTPGAQTLINDGIAFALSGEKTGAYITLSCYYHFSPSGTPVSFLSGFGSFVVAGAESTTALNDVHIVAAHPALGGLTDESLSNWSNSVHSNFETWPEIWPSAFEVLAIALHSDGSYTSGDGSKGYPYILARGVVPVLCGDGKLDPGEECDDGNNTPGDGCNESCNLEKCVDSDGDGVCGDVDNCPDVSNPEQSDNDSDGVGDVCDPDDDNDGILDTSDNCQYIANPDQKDSDSDGEGDVCDQDTDADTDGDGVVDSMDQCASTPAGVTVNEVGCSIDQLCPCTNNWKHHVHYVHCVAHASGDFLDEGLITKRAWWLTVFKAGKSTCGKK